MYLEKKILCNHDQKIEILDEIKGRNGLKKSFKSWGQRILIILVALYMYKDRYKSALFLYMFHTIIAHIYVKRIYPCSTLVLYLEKNKRNAFYKTKNIIFILFSN